jgi:hypothetical protein
VLIVGGNQSAAGGYNVDNSVRINRPSSDSMSGVTNGTSTNQNKYTVSFWTKRGRLSNGSTLNIMEGYTGSSDTGTGSIFWRTSEALVIGGYNTNWRITNRLFRDVSAWYHIVFSVDTTQATADDRIKVYVNGVEETSFSTKNNPSQNSSTGLNNNSAALNLFRRVLFGVNDNHGDGYFSEFCFIDGSALDPTSFGEFDEDSGIWKLIDVSGLTFGTNGFYLQFEDSSALGDDTSGNSNDFTLNNITSIDQSTDTCTNNFATWNRLIPPTFTNHNLLDGNLTVEGEVSSQNTAFSTFAVSSGKWFCEMKLTVEGNATSSVPNFGIASTADFRHADSEAYYETSGTNIYAGRVNSAQINHNGSDSGTDLSSTPDVGDIMGLALDLDSGTKTLKFYLNGSLVGTVNINTDEYCFITAVKEDDNKATVQGNFGGTNTYTVSSGNADGNGYGNFEYSVPSGYYALNTKNLAEYG